MPDKYLPAIRDNSAPPPKKAKPIKSQVDPKNLSTADWEKELFDAALKFDWKF